MIHWLFPRFPREKEKDFLVFYTKETLSQYRFALLAAIALYSVVGFLDYLVVPKYIDQIWIFRFRILLPSAVITYLSSYLSKREALLQSLAAYTAGIGGIMVSFMISLDRSMPDHPYFVGLLTALFFSYGILRLRFVYASAQGWASTLFFIGFVLTRRIPLTTPVLYTYIFFLIITNVIGMMIAYFLEKSIRTEYLQFVMLRETNAKLKAESITDSLTEIPNRRYFDDKLREVLTHSLNEKKIVSLIVLDIDDFKLFNDSRGHKAGDECLKKVAECLCGFAKRKDDFVARYGGEEFAVVLAKTPLESALQLAERIRKSVEDMKIHYFHDNTFKKITVSLGVTSISNFSPDSGNELFLAADKALYEAKAKGKNQVRKFELEINS